MRCLRKRRKTNRGRGRPRGRMKRGQLLTRLNLRSNQPNVVDARSFGDINSIGDRTKVQVLVPFDEHHLRSARGEDRLQSSRQIGLLHIGFVDFVCRLLLEKKKKLAKDGE